MNTILEFPRLDNKRILFLSETYYQTMNCMNIAIHTNNAKCDLFINEMYANSGEIAGKIREQKIFHKVETYNVKYGKLVKAIRFWDFEHYTEQIFKRFDYDVVFFSSRDFLTRCVVTYCKYIMPKIALVSYDEGLGTYISRMESYTNSVERGIIKIRFHDDANLITDKILYKPEAYIGQSEDIKLYRMPKIDSAAINAVNLLYQYDNKKAINGKFIYFDNYFDGKNETNRKVLKCLVDKTKGELTIKKHPQTPEGTYAIGNVYEYPSLPYEVIAINDKDIEEKVLITSMSTSVWTPMLLFNKFPQIILLYPLFETTEVNDAKKIIEKMISLYKKEKIVVVKNLSDLENLELN